MAEEISPIRKLVISLNILVSAIIIIVCAYFGWINTTWSNAQVQGVSITVLPQVGCVVVSLWLVFLLIGLGARRAGYTQSELNKWGDDAMSGKPPL